MVLLFVNMMFQLPKSDNSGSSTTFIEFMLNVINKSLRETIEKSTPASSDYMKRAEFALSQLDDWFDRPPSFMRLLGLQWVMSLLYPEHYEDDLIDETLSFFKTFLNISIEPADAKHLLSGRF